MSIDQDTIPEIIETFAVTTGVPAFLLQEDGSIPLASPGFPPQDYAFADQEALQCFFLNPRICPQQYYTLLTEHQFLYNFVPVPGGDTGGLLVSGPARFHLPGEQQLTALLRQHQIPLRNRAEIAARIARLPEVSILRLGHLGRVLLSLCHGYCTEGRNVSADQDLMTEVEPGREPAITFSLVEEEKYSAIDLIQYVKRLMLSGDIAGLRALQARNLVLPLNRVDEKDELISAKYRLITCCAAWVGMVFDHQLPYEQVMMILDQYTRLAHRTDSIPELTRMIYDSVESFAWLVRKYSVQQYTKPVRQVIQYIQANLATRISLQDLADVTGLSQGYLSRLIKKETGSSPVELIDSYRIDEGRYLLLNTDYSILQIAELTGYRYQYHFSVRFRKHTGMTPTAFRLTGGVRDR